MLQAAIPMAKRKERCNGTRMGQHTMKEYDIDLYAVSLEV